MGRSVYIQLVFITIILPVNQFTHIKYKYTLIFFFFFFFFFKGFKMDRIWQRKIGRGFL